MTFARWAKTYGPIYSIKTGSNTIVVLNNNDVAKEVAHLSRSLPLVVLFMDVPMYLPDGYLSIVITVKQMQQLKRTIMC